MQSPRSMGMNRTGVDMSPDGAKQMANAVQEFPPTSTVGTHAQVDLRTSYLSEADPIGTVPVPGTVTGVAKAGMQKLMGRHAEVFIDLLGGRLAFERTGTRLYDAFLGKCLVRKDEATMLSLEELSEFRAEEAAHIGICWDALRQLGADPTTVTPLADVNAVTSSGLYQIITDPRTSVGQSLHAIHAAELADNDGWVLLIKLAKKMRQDEMVTKFRQALHEEDRHLKAVRRWMDQITLSQAGV
jgi:rubrerythrin